MTKLQKFKPNYATVPGEIIDEHREVHGMTQAQLATRLGFSLKHVNRLLAGLEPVTPETAMKLESIFGVAAVVWINLEAAYREFHARSNEKQDLLNELPMLDEIPYRAIAKLGWIRSTGKGPDTIKELRSHYGVGSLSYVPDVWEKVHSQYTGHPDFAGNVWAIMAWLAQGDRHDRPSEIGIFDAQALQAMLPDFESSGVSDSSTLVENFAEFGIVLAFIPTPKGLPVTYATRWLSKDTALIQLNPQAKNINVALFRAVAHLLLHGKRQQFIGFVRPPLDDTFAQEAAEFASRLLQPHSNL